MAENLIKQIEIKPNVFNAGPEHSDQALRTILLAFSADPQLRWLWPLAEEYLKYGLQFFDAFGGNAFDNKSAFFTRQFSGVALWCPREFKPMKNAFWLF